MSQCQMKRPGLIGGTFPNEDDISGTLWPLAQWGPALLELSRWIWHLLGEQRGLPHSIALWSLQALGGLFPPFSALVA